MKLKKIMSISNSNRHTLNIQKGLLSKSNRIVKSIVKANKKSNGRSSLNGRITV
jgi:ribosomal protein L2